MEIKRKSVYRNFIFVDFCLFFPTKKSSSYKPLSACRAFSVLSNKMQEK